MKAAIVFTGGGPALFLTSYDSLQHTGFIERLSCRGIHRFITYEVDITGVEEKYREHFEAMRKDLKETEDVRCLDYNGFNVFHSLSFNEMRIPIYHEL